VLAAVGATLQSVMRESDFAGRYGGEEFVMLLPSADLEAGLQVAERVRAAIADIQLFEENLSVTAGFGVAVFPGPCVRWRSTDPKRRPSALPGEGEGP
jgi:diguanylate cyclase (GGDEF)-like protein